MFMGHNYSGGYCLYCKYKHNETSFFFNLNISLTRTKVIGNGYSFDLWTGKLHLDVYFIQLNRCGLDNLMNIK